MTSIATRPGWCFQGATFLQNAALCADVSSVHQLEVISSRSHSITITWVQLHTYIVRTALWNRVIFIVLLSALLIAANLSCDDKAEEISMFGRGLALQPYL
jgi:hypothetical protein